MVASAGVQPHEQPIAGQRAVRGHRADDGGVGGADVHLRPARPGAMPRACVMSSSCSPSSHLFLAGARGAGAVGGDQRDRHLVGLADVLVVRGQVGEVGAVVLEQRDVLAGAGQRAAAVVGGAHVAAQERRRRARAGDLCKRRLGARGIAADAGVRQHVVVHAGDLQNFESCRNRRLSVGRKKYPRLRGVLIFAHVDVEGAVDICNRSGYRYEAPADRRHGHGQAVSFGKGDDCGVIFGGGREARGGFFDTEILVKQRSCAVLQVPHQPVEFGFIAQRQVDGQLQLRIR